MFFFEDGNSGGDVLRAAEMPKVGFEWKGSLSG
jgi:hypothetical protein